MLNEKGIRPIIIPPDVDETLPYSVKPHLAVMYLALKKALSSEVIAKEKGYADGEMLIAADTVVVYRNTIIGKPSDPREVFEILKRLRGERHRVLTGVALIATGTVSRRVFYETSDVIFKTYSDDVIREYAGTAEPYDKAGGYAVQGTWGKYIDRIEGDVDNVIGLPWTSIQKLLNLV